MKSYSFNYDVHIFDTDCYGVVWHGSYTKWLEMGRVNFFKTLMDLDMKEASDKHDIIFPVTEQTIRFKKSGRLGDVLRLTTWVEPDSPKLVFHQEIRNLHTDRVLVEAKTDVVMINSEGRMYRRFPEMVAEKLKLLDS